MLPGRFLSYPDRFLNWHYKWFLLVIDFGDPFKYFRDWNLNGTQCVSDTTYPFSRLGCSLFDNFGQNFIMIFVVLLFCLIMTSVITLIYYKKKKSNKVSDITSNPNQDQESIAKKYFLMNGLGLNYFLRFMDSIQPSLIFFTLLQFNTFFKDSHLAVSVFFAVVLFMYYLLAGACSALLTLKLWRALKQSSEQVVDFQSLATSEKSWLRHFTFQYSGLTKASRWWHLIAPEVEFFRALLISHLSRDSEEKSTGLFGANLCGRDPENWIHRKSSLFENR